MHQHKYFYKKTQSYKLIIEPTLSHSKLHSVSELFESDEMENSC